MTLTLDSPHADWINTIQTSQDSPSRTQQLQSVQLTRLRKLSVDTFLYFGRVSDRLIYVELLCKAAARHPFLLHNDESYLDTFDSSTTSFVPFELCR